MVSPGQYHSLSFPRAASCRTTKYLTPRTTVGSEFCRKQRELLARLPCLHRHRLFFAELTEPVLSCFGCPLSCRSPQACPSLPPLGGWNCGAAGEMPIHSLGHAYCVLGGVFVFLPRAGMYRRSGSTSTWVLQLPVHGRSGSFALHYLPTLERFALSQLACALS